jgi:hypothetical protein
MNRKAIIKFCCDSAEYFNHKQEYWESMTNKELNEYYKWYNFLLDNKESLGY